MDIAALRKQQDASENKKGKKKAQQDEDSDGGYGEDEFNWCAYL